jgi:hypothetical protein
MLSICSKMNFTFLSIGASFQLGKSVEKCPLPIEKQMFVCSAPIKIQHCHNYPLSSPSASTFLLYPFLFPISPPSLHFLLPTFFFFAFALHLFLHSTFFQLQDLSQSSPTSFILFFFFSFFSPFLSSFLFLSIESLVREASEVHLEARVGFEQTVEIRIERIGIHFHL